VADGKPAARSGAGEHSGGADDRSVMGRRPRSV